MNKLPSRSRSFFIKNSRIPSENQKSIKLPLAPVLKQFKSVKIYKCGLKSSLANSLKKFTENNFRNCEQQLSNTYQPKRLSIDSAKSHLNQLNLTNQNSSDNNSCKDRLKACIINLNQLEIENNSFKIILNNTLDILNEIFLQLETEFTQATNFNQMLKKLEKLSIENIELSIKNEKYKSQLSSFKSQKNLNENVFHTKKLIQELAEKNEYIDRCQEEIRELKRRELKILKKLDRKVYNCADKSIVVTAESSIINNSRCEFRKYSIPTLKFPD